MLASGTLRTRFAPSPTGFLHQGHVWSALCVWSLAGKTGAKITLRLEDHDQGRCRQQYADAICQDLEWLGLQWDNLTVQSKCRDRYEQALQRLEETVGIYYCACTRKDLRRNMATSSGTEAPYPNICRNLDLSSPGHGLRLRLPQTLVQWQELRRGLLEETPLLLWGDTLIRDRHQQWTYQFSSVVDDVAEEINLVIRGLDIAPSTGRQVLLAQLLNDKVKRNFYHHSLLCDAHGRKLSKRQHDTSIGAQRSLGVSAQTLLGTVCTQMGAISAERPLCLEEALEFTYRINWGQASAPLLPQ